MNEVVAFWSVAVMMFSCCIVTIYKQSISGAIFIVPLVLSGIAGLILHSHIGDYTYCLAMAFVSLLTVVALSKINTTTALHLILLSICVIVTNIIGLFQARELIEPVFYQPLMLVIYIVGIILIGNDNERRDSGSDNILDLYSGLYRSIMCRLRHLH